MCFIMVSPRVILAVQTEGQRNDRKQKKGISVRKNKKTERQRKQGSDLTKCKCNANANFTLRIKHIRKSKEKGITGLSQNTWTQQETHQRQEVRLVQKLMHIKLEIRTFIFF